MSFGFLIKAKLPVSLKNALKDSNLNHFRLASIELRRKIFPDHHFGQTAEDVLLNNYLPENRGTYVDVGAGAQLVVQIPMVYINGVGAACV